MARFRKKVRRASAKSYKARSRRSKGENPLMTVGAAFVYGAARGYISTAISPLTSKVPLGDYADEVVLGTAGYFMAKKGSGIVKSAGKAILTIEAASLGSQIVNKAMTQTASQESLTYDF